MLQPQSIGAEDVATPAGEGAYRRFVIGGNFFQVGSAGDEFLRHMMVFAALLQQYLQQIHDRSEATR